jgi:hypothetical protein
MGLKDDTLEQTFGTPVSGRYSFHCSVELNHHPPTKKTEQRMEQHGNQHETTPQRNTATRPLANTSRSRER